MIVPTLFYCIIVSTGDRIHKTIFDYEPDIKNQTLATIFQVANSIFEQLILQIKLLTKRLFTEYENI